MNQDSREFIAKVISYVMKSSLEGVTIKSFMRVLVGSYAIGTETESSDIDLLCVYDGQYPHSRFKRNIFGKEVSVCFIPIEEMENDGKDRKYGGYYSVKCLNPSYTFYHDDHLRLRICTSAGHFIGSLTSYISGITGKSLFTAEEITVHTFMAYMGSNYGYISYFLSYFLAKDFLHVREGLVQKVTYALSSAKVIVMKKDLYEYKHIQKSYQEYHYTRLVISSVRAAYGGHVHDKDHTFQNSYYANAEQKMIHLHNKGLTEQTIIDFFKLRANIETLVI